MSIEVKMPQMGESIVEGTVTRWLVKEGDRVQEDQPLCEISTDKVDTEISSPATGMIAKLIAAEGETLQMGAPLAVLRLTHTNSGAPSDAHKQMSERATDYDADLLAARLQELRRQIRARNSKQSGKGSSLMTEAQRLWSDTNNLCGHCKERYEQARKDIAEGKDPSHNSDIYCEHHDFLLGGQMESLVVSPELTSLWERGSKILKQTETLIAEIEVRFGVPSGAGAWHSGLTARPQLGQNEEQNIPQAEQKKSQANDSSVPSELNGLIGLQNVKLSLQELEAALKIDQKRAEYGLKSTRMSLHAVFKGNPGTGKTSVARIYAQMLNDMGYLTKGHLIEANRSTLIGQYLGETAIKTQAILQRSLGGVLFIDEAYALIESDNPGFNDPYGKECVDTLLKFIEDHREDIVVAIAGYPDKMDELLKANPGFKSRFVQFFDFEDYSDDELRLILSKMARDMQYTASAEVADSVIRLVSPLRGTKEFGNAREIRNLLEGARRKQAFRVGSEAGSESKEEVMRLTAEDFCQAFAALHGKISIDNTASTPNLRLVK